MPAARLELYQRFEFADGAIVEMRIWRVAEPVPPSEHAMKYSLFYGVPGKRIVGYDNERGKGDPRHLGEREEPYLFVSPEKLIVDFIADVAKARGGSL